MHKTIFVVGLALATLTSIAPAAESAAERPVAVAAASDLQTALPELLARFEKATGVRTTVSFGSSGSFFAQIQNGAPFDVFFSADVDYPNRLVQAHYADADTLYSYATGRLVLWTRNGTGIDVSKGLTALRDARVRRVAIANPDFAPYGRAAVAALQSARLYDEVKPKLVLGENISQAAQLAESGNADAGLISHSLALGPALKRSGTFIDISSSMHPPIVQAAVVVSASTNKDAGRSLLKYLRSEAARMTLESFGFGPPPRQ
jgi:molybdate transport system substrate-binding protein